MDMTMMRDIAKGNVQADLKEEDEACRKYGVGQAFKICMSLFVRANPTLIVYH